MLFGLPFALYLVAPNRLADLFSPMVSYRRGTSGNLQPGRSQGGILRIDKDTGEYTRFTEENGLPAKLICRPLSEADRLVGIATFSGYS